MSIVKVEKNSYTVEPLYQWDKNQSLKIYGLSLPSIPEIHFSNTDMSRAIVKQASMDAAGIITVDVPNSLLQKPYPIAAYVCIYEGNVFRSLYKIEIPVNARTQPSDYTLVNDPEVYSFNALENQVANVLYKYDEVDKKHNDAVTKLNEAETAYKNAKSEVEDAVADAVNIAMETIPTISADEITEICV